MRSFLGVYSSFVYVRNPFRDVKFPLFLAFFVGLFFGYIRFHVDIYISLFMVLYNYSLQITVVRKIFTTSKLHTINICCLLLSLIFLLSINILLEQKSILGTHIKHCRSTVLQGRTQGGVKPPFELDILQKLYYKASV